MESPHGCALSSRRCLLLLPSDIFDSLLSSIEAIGVAFMYFIAALLFL